MYGDRLRDGGDWPPLGLRIRLEPSVLGTIEEPKKAGGELSPVTAMESVIKVFLQACKMYCGKSAPSKKEVTAMLALLQREGLLTSLADIYEPGKWDTLSTALSQHAMSTQKAAVLKTWVLILGALKAAREEKGAMSAVRIWLGLGGSDECTGGVYRRVYRGVYRGGWAGGVF